jgi:ribosome maturation factor RimP
LHSILPRGKGANTFLVATLKVGLQSPLFSFKDRSLSLNGGTFAETMKPVDVAMLTELVRPAVEGQGFDLVDLEWKHESGSWVLRLFIDRQGVYEPGQGVTLDDCAQVSREISALLDVHDAVPKERYSLEVSSPGLNRPLTRESDFRRFVGQKAKIRTRHAVGKEGKEGRRNFSGTLLAVQAGPPATVRIDVGDRQYELCVDDVEKANLVYEFEGLRSES